VSLTPFQKGCQERVGIAGKQVSRVIVDGDCATQGLFGKAAAAKGDRLQSALSSGFDVIGGVADEERFVCGRVAESLKCGFNDVRMWL
jgi:hypothetical protein